MEARSKDVEILVHINAPSRVVDDARYRQLAEAYLTFNPSRRTALPPLQKQSEAEETSKSNHVESLSGAKDQAPVPASSSQEYATPAPKALLLDSQDLSFQSALDNRESPRLGDTTVGITLDLSTSLLEEEQPRTQESWIAPPSEIGDSYPMPDASLLRKSPTKVFAQYLRSSTTGQVRNHPTAILQESPAADTQANTQIEVPSSPPMQHIATQDSPQEHLVLPTIPSSPPIPINGHRVVPFSPKGAAAEDDILVPTSDAALDVTHISSSAVINGPDTSYAEKDELPPVSDDLQDITHVSGSSIGGDPKHTTSDLGEAAPAREAMLDDPLEVTHITSSSIANLSGMVRVLDPGVHAMPQHVQHTTHILSSSFSNSQDPPSLLEDVLPVQNTSGNLPSALPDDTSRHEQEPHSSPPAKRRRRSGGSSPSPTTNTDNIDRLPAGSPDQSPNNLATAVACLEIMAPSPSAGIHVLQADDLVPSQLAKLTVDLSSRYRPSPPKRDIDPLERGYWLLDCDAWPPAVRESTWVFLQQYLRSGLAGWGVWCRREEKPHRFLKAYCWGHVVKHAYLLLYLASERRLKGTTASWIDADGEVVIEVPSHSK